MTLASYRDRLTTGIVHFGPGAFHRAHQADYIDRLLQDDPRWGIAAVSLRSGGTVEALRRQDGCYTLAVLDRAPNYRVLGAHSAFVGPGDDVEVRRLIADPAVRVVSSTVTEKGYCLSPDGTLDFDHADIVHDLAAPTSPRSLVGWLALGLADRRAAGAAAFTALCCDNLAGNGRKLGAAVRAFAERLDPELSHWIAGEARFPDTMVDSITPATTDALRSEVRGATGFDDAIPVAREAYAAWVIEDVLPSGGPDLAGAGAILTGDVAGWERAKLRLLNGAHSTLAYFGLLLGHETVADAMGDADLARFVERMMREEIVPSLAGSPLNLDTYVGEVLDRFRNPGIGHKLTQIAWDGSQKLLYRLLDTVAEALAVGRPVERLAIAVAGWMRFIRRQADAGVEIVDPLAPQLVAAASSGESLLALGRIFPPALAADARFRTAVLRAYGAQDVRTLLKEAALG